MKYAIVRQVNGNFFIENEGFTTPDSAILAWYDVCKANRAAQDVERATISIVDENFDPIDGGKYKETIVHPQNNAE